MKDAKQFFSDFTDNELLRSRIFEEMNRLIDDEALKAWQAGQKAAHILGYDIPDEVAFAAALAGGDTRDTGVGIVGGKKEPCALHDGDDIVAAADLMQRLRQLIHVEGIHLLVPFRRHQSDFIGFTLVIGISLFAAIQKVVENTPLFLHHSVLRVHLIPSLLLLLFIP